MTVLRATQSVVVDHPTDHGAFTIRENDPFDSKDPLVKEYPWAFESDVERATAGPGEKRSVKRR